MWQKVSVCAGVSFPWVFKESYFWVDDIWSQTEYQEGARDFEGESSASSPDIQILSPLESLVQMQPQPQTSSYLPTWIPAHNTLSSLQDSPLHTLDIGYLCTCLPTLLKFPILKDLLFFLSPAMLSLIIIQKYYSLF